MLQIQLYIIVFLTWWRRKETCLELLEALKGRTISFSFTDIFINNPIYLFIFIILSTSTIYSRGVSISWPLWLSWPAPPFSIHRRGSLFKYSLFCGGWFSAFPLQVHSWRLLVGRGHYDDGRLWWHDVCVISLSLIECPTSSKKFDSTRTFTRTYTISLQKKLLHAEHLKKNSPYC